MIKVCPKLTCPVQNRFTLKGEEGESCHFLCTRCGDLLLIPYKESKRAKRARFIFLFLFLVCISVSIFFLQKRYGLFNTIVNMASVVNTSSKEENFIGEYTYEYKSSFGKEPIRRTLVIKQLETKQDTIFIFYDIKGENIKDEKGYILIDKSFIYLNKLPFGNNREGIIEIKNNKPIFTATDNSWKIN